MRAESDHLLARASSRRKEIIAKWQQRTLWDDSKMLDYGRVYYTPLAKYMHCRTIALNMR